MAAIGFIPVQAPAHVKWFCSVADATQSPAGLNRVLTQLLALVCSGFLLLVFAGFLVDSVLYGYGITQFGIFHMTGYVFLPGIAA